MTGPPPIGEPELEFCRRCSTCVAPGYLGRNAMGQRAFSVVFMPGHPRRLASCSAIVIALRGPFFCTGLGPPCETFCARCNANASCATAPRLVRRHTRNSCSFTDSKKARLMKSQHMLTDLKKAEVMKSQHMKWRIHPQGQTQHQAIFVAILGRGRCQRHLSSLRSPTNYKDRCHNRSTNHKYRCHKLP